LCYHRSMRSIGLIFASLLAFAGLAAAADKPDPLAHARLLYNQRQFVAAVSEAEEARSVPSRADSADLIAARAYLERFRESSESDDLTNARDRLRRLDPQRLAGSERPEFLVGVGEALYFDGDFGAAADVFEALLVRQDDLMPVARELVLDWWASALDRDAQPRSDLERTIGYRRIRDRMQDEVARRPASVAAAYWLSAAARGQGDVQAAWDAAQAGWVRSALAGDRGAALRGDLDRLVLRGLVPDRARALSQPPETLRGEWERFKERWAK
jgi:hypothetical protein